jgi:hypothetical protein
MTKGTFEVARGTMGVFLHSLVLFISSLWLSFPAHAIRYDLSYPIDRRTVVGPPTEADYVFLGVGLLLVVGPLAGLLITAIRSVDPFSFLRAGLSTPDSAILGVFSPLLPTRLANEEIGDALEDIERRIARDCPSWHVWAKVVSTIIWASLHAIATVWSPGGEKKGAGK